MFVTSELRPFSYSNTRDTGPDTPIGSPSLLSKGPSALGVPTVSARQLHSSERTQRVNRPMKLWILAVSDLISVVRGEDPLDSLEQGGP